MNEELKKIMDGDAGMLLKRWLFSHYKRLKDIEELRECDNPEGQAVEVRGQRKALQIVKGMLREIMDIEAYNQQDKKDEDKLYNLP